MNKMQDIYIYIYILAKKAILMTTFNNKCKTREVEFN